MNPVLAHCGHCQEIPNAKTASKFFLTGCGQVFCQKCLGPQGICKKCGKNCARRSITNSSVGNLFQDPSSKIAQLQQAIGFQSSRYKAFFKSSNARYADSLKALKEKDCKLCILEKQFTENRNVIKELKKQLQLQTSFQTTSNPANSTMNTTRASNHSPYGIFPSNTYHHSPSSTNRRNHQNNLSAEQLYQSTPLPGRNRPSLKNFVPSREKSISKIGYNRR